MYVSHSNSSLLYEENFWISWWIFRTAGGAAKTLAFDNPSPVSPLKASLCQLNVTLAELLNEILKFEVWSLLIHKYIAVRKLNCVFTLQKWNYHNQEKAKVLIWSPGGRLSGQIPTQIHILHQVWFAEICLTKSQFYN